MVCNMEKLNGKVMFHTATHSVLSRWHCPSHTLSSSALQPWGCFNLKQSLWTDGAVGMLLHCGGWLESYKEWQQREKCCEITQKVCDTTSIGIQGNVVFKGLVNPRIKPVIIYYMTFFQGNWVMCWVLWNWHEWGLEFSSF